MWIVRMVTGEPGTQAVIRDEKFETKRGALAFISTTPHSYIKRVGHTYTIYPKKR